MMIRQGSVILLRPDAIEEYEQYHREPWAEVQHELSAAGFRNYSIYRFGETLFSYREYVGDDYAADMARLDAHEPSQRWLAIMHRLQVGVNGAIPAQWVQLPEIFHLD